jgi:plasmid stabilization system protein ParE
MPYQIIFRERAKKEYAQSVAWYIERSVQAAENFVAQVKATISAIQLQPDFYRTTYKKFREAKTKKYPYSIIYFLDIDKQQIIITSIFHQKRNPLHKFNRG